jgi:hypothetical protein
LWFGTQANLRWQTDESSKASYLYSKTRIARHPNAKQTAQAIKALNAFVLCWRSREELAV